MKADLDISAAPLLYLFAPLLGNAGQAAHRGKERRIPELDNLFIRMNRTGQKQETRRDDQPTATCASKPSHNYLLLSVYILANFLILF
jgi:hypothetical protein